MAVSGRVTALPLSDIQEEAANVRNAGVIILQKIVKKLKIE